MPRPIRSTAPVYAGSVASQLQASDLWGGITVYTDDRLMDGFIRVGIDDPQYFALHQSGVIPVSREMAYGDVAPDPSPARGGRVRMEWIDEAAYAQPPEEMLSIENITDDGQMTIRRGTGATGLSFYGNPVRDEPERAPDHRHEWAVTAMHMDGGVRFDLGCAHCDAVHRNVHRDHMERLIDSNTEPEPTARNERSIPQPITGGHRFPTERWNEGGYERTIFRVEGFRQDGELVASQRSLQISDQARRDPEQIVAYRQRIIAELVDECERLGMLRDERVRISERPW